MERADITGGVAPLFDTGAVQSSEEITAEMAILDGLNRHEAFLEDEDEDGAQRVIDELLLRFGQTALDPYYSVIENGELND